MYVLILYNLDDGLNHRYVSGHIEYHQSICLITKKTFLFLPKLPSTGLNKTDKFVAVRLLIIGIIANVI